MRSNTHSLSFVLAAMAASSLSAQGPRVLVNESFQWPAATYQAPDWVNSAPVPIRFGWSLANARTNFRASTRNDLVLNGSTALLRCQANSATGGYPVFFIEVPQRPTSWRMTVRYRVNVMPLQRTVPDCKFNYCPVPGTWLQGTAPAGQSAFQIDQAQRSLALVQPLGPSCNHLTTTANGPAISTGVWFTTEICNTPGGSEGRIWAAGQPRPLRPTLTAGDLGPVTLIAFQGPNWQNFDYEIDDVVLEDLNVADFTTVGSTCGGSAGPVLTNSCLPSVGQPFEVRVEPFPPLAVGLALIGFRLQTPPISLANYGGPACALHVLPVVSDPLSRAGSIATWTLPIPANPNLIGQTFHLQALVMDPNPFGWVPTNAASATIGL